jgi:hypothetical protein
MLTRIEHLETGFWMLFVYVHLADPVPGSNDLFKQVE